MTAMPSEGDRAPEFELQDQDGETVRLSDHAGKTVVLYFYPKADTPGCTTQACGVRDRGAEYEAANAVVLGVSPDTPRKLRAFADKYGLPFTLLADEGHRVAEEYGVWVEKSMYGRTYWGNERSTFVIGPDGTIQKVFRKVKPAEHDDLVLGAIAA
jgi:peroxiredoxin Q/BCP